MKDDDFCDGDSADDDDLTMLIVMVVMMREGERRIVSLCDVAATAVRKVPAVS